MLLYTYMLGQKTILLSLISITIPHLSPSLSRWNWVTNRHISVGPTLVPGIRSSAMRAGQKSMLPGVPYNLKQRCTHITRWVWMTVLFIQMTTEHFLKFIHSKKKEIIIIPISWVTTLRLWKNLGITQLAREQSSDPTKSI